MKRNARKRLRAKVDKLRRETGVEDSRLLHQMAEIHYKANRMSQKAYKVVDRASDFEAKKVLETELCRAMWLRCGEKTLAYRPYRGETVENFTFGY